MVSLHLLLAFCPNLSAQELSPEDGEAMTMIREADLGLALTRVHEKFLGVPA